MKKYDIKGKKIEPYNIVCAITSEPDYEMTRIILLEDMPDTNYNEYILMEGYHCSCYGFDETEWDCTQLTEEELKIILEQNAYGLRAELKNILRL